MKNNRSHEILIVGAGTMGASLAQTYAQNGFDVALLDISDEIVARGFRTIDAELQSAKGKIFRPEEIDAIKDRMYGTASYEDACASPNLRLVIEAATEKIEIKKKIFSQLDRLAPKEAIFATNSSSLNSNILAHATQRPDKVVWMHYFYLPHKNRAAEYAGTDTASQTSLNQAREYLTLGGKIPTWIRGSRKGGVADIIFVSLLLEATRMLEDGYRMSTIEDAGKRAYDIPVGFFKLMDNTGLPVGLASMYSFSDSSNRNDPLFNVYGNFFAPRQNYIDLINRFCDSKTDQTIRWFTPDERSQLPENEETIEQLVGQFHAIGFLTATEVVDAGLITIEDLEFLTQNAFLWRSGPFTIMNKVGPAYVGRVLEARARLAAEQKQDFPISETLKSFIGKSKPWNFFLRRVHDDVSGEGSVRWITLSNPRAANAMDNDVFAQWAESFQRANDDPTCKVIVFDTAPIKTFIAGADITTFIRHIRENDIDAIVKDTRRWQEVIFTIMTGTSKPKIAIVDGKALGGGVEVASAFAYDPHTVVVMTSRTSFTLPETRLGIYPGLRGTILLPQIIHRATDDIEIALAYSRYLIFSGSTSSSAQLLSHMGFANILVEPLKRNSVVWKLARWIIENGKIPDANERSAMSLENIPVTLSFRERQEVQTIRDLMCVDDLLPTLYAIARGDREAHFIGWRKAFAQTLARRVFTASPFAIERANWLINSAFEKYVQGVSNENIAAYELQNHLGEVFDYPDALLGLEATMQGAFPSFNRGYPFRSRST